MAIHYGRQWREEAICAGKPIAFFYDQAYSAAAKALCVRCPVRVECLTEAVQNDEYGVWGGATETERRIILKRSFIDRMPIPTAAQRFFQRERP